MDADAPCLLAIDQGTTSSRAIVFDLAGNLIASAQAELPQIYPRPGWVEHDPEAIWSSVVATCRAALAEAADKDARVVAIGVTNQRETTVVWERATGKPIHNAIVWQDRRTADQCTALAAAGHEPLVADLTGLVIDPYFSATKLAWILDHVEGARAHGVRGELCFGTVDSFLIWRLTNGRRHVTDAANASRTSLYALEAARWDESLLDVFAIPCAILPEVVDNAGEVAISDAETIGVALPITGVAGDQQAALVGQACFAVGEAKCTYGTGAFLVANTGRFLVRSRSRLLGTVAYRLGGETTFALEGSILAAGAAIQWLRDGLGLIERASDIEALAASISETGGVYLVPAFAGLGAPYWAPDARAAIVGLSRGSGRAEISRAALEAVAHQTADLTEAMATDGCGIATLKIDGGMAENSWFAGHLADILSLEVSRPKNTESTAWGAACLAALGAGLFGSLEDIAGAWTAADRFAPAMSPAHRMSARAGWRDAVRCVLRDADAGHSRPECSD